jgi:hypothetical protein
MENSSGFLFWLFDVGCSVWVQLAFLVFDVVCLVWVQWIAVLVV